VPGVLRLLEVLTKPDSHFVKWTTPPVVRVWPLKTEYCAVLGSAGVQTPVLGAMASPAGSRKATPTQFFSRSLR
jgi:hypothetical protein